MADQFSCTDCEEQLRPHCEHRRCGWWKCTNRECTANIYDIAGHRLIRRDGSVERT